jgi:hypothetical protein
LTRPFFQHITSVPCSTNFPLCRFFGRTTRQEGRVAGRAAGREADTTGREDGAANPTPPPTHRNKHTRPLIIFPHRKRKENNTVTQATHNTLTKHNETDTFNSFLHECTGVAKEEKKRATHYRRMVWFDGLSFVVWCCVLPLMSDVVTMGRETRQMRPSQTVAHKAKKNPQRDNPMSRQQSLLHRDPNPRLQNHPPLNQHPTSALARQISPKRQIHPRHQNHLSDPSPHPNPARPIHPPPQGKISALS